MKADRAGWFHSYQEEQAYCPVHVPDWVPAWRAKQEAKLHKVEKSFTKLPAVLKCGGCKLTWTEPGENPELLAEIRDLAYLHARKTGHRVTVTTAQELTVGPAVELFPESS